MRPLACTAFALLAGVDTAYTAPVASDISSSRRLMSTRAAHPLNKTTQESSYTPLQIHKWIDDQSPGGARTTTSFINSNSSSNWNEPKIMLSNNMLKEGYYYLDDAQDTFDLGHNLAASNDLAGWGGFLDGIYDNGKEQDFSSFFKQMHKFKMGNAMKDGDKYQESPEQLDFTEGSDRISSFDDVIEVKPQPPMTPEELAEIVRELEALAYEGDSVRREPDSQES
jgi:hypothetical protein